MSAREIYLPQLYPGRASKVEFSFSTLFLNPRYYLSYNATSVIVS
jgi:hypothetical protein